MRWTKIEDGLPDDNKDGFGFCTFAYGEVRDDMWYSAFKRNNDGWGSACEGKCFYAPNKDPDCGGEFKNDGVTHWMEKNLPDPPNT